MKKLILLFLLPVCLMAQERGLLPTVSNPRNIYAPQGTVGITMNGGVGATGEIMRIYGDSYPFGWRASYSSFNFASTHPNSWTTWHNRFAAFAGTGQYFLWTDGGIRLGGSEIGQAEATYGVGLFNHYRTVLVDTVKILRSVRIGDTTAAPGVSVGIEGGGVTSKWANVDSIVARMFVRDTIVPIVTDSSMWWYVDIEKPQYIKSIHDAVRSGKITIKVIPSAYGTGATNTINFNVVSDSANGVSILGIEAESHAMHGGIGQFTVQRSIFGPTIDYVVYEVSGGSRIYTQRGGYSTYNNYHLRLAGTNNGSIAYPTTLTVYYSLPVGAASTWYVKIDNL